MHEVAARAGVSIKTVSNYVNGYPYMRDSTKERVQQAINELQYKVNLSARSLREGRTRTVALVVPELNQAYFAELAQAVISFAAVGGLRVFIETTGGDPEREREILTGARGWLFDGLIFGPLGLGGGELGAMKSDVPVVFIGDRIEGSEFDYVTMANADAAEAATSHLLRAGRRRIVALGADDSAAPSAPSLRRLGYERAHDGFDAPTHQELFIGPLEWHRSAGSAAVASLLDSGVKFDAIFGFNDALALGAMRELQRRSIRIPEDVAVVGFDDTEDAAFSTPSLTTVNPGREEIARLAVELLVDRMAHVEDDDTRQASPVVTGFELVVRESA